MNRTESGSSSSGRSASPSTYWRVSDEAQTDVTSSNDTTARSVGDAFLDLVWASRRSIEQARCDDLTFLGEVELHVRSAAHRYHMAMDVMLEDSERASDSLATLEDEHFTFLLHWEEQERIIRRMQHERCVVVDATLRLAASLRPQAQCA